MALELQTLPSIHPGVAILTGYGTSTVVRLSLDPTTLPSGTIIRPVSVNWVARVGGLPPRQVTRDIGWSDVPQHTGKNCLLWINTKNERTITEEAAIGVMALLLKDLENATITRVVQIGGGGDYHLTLQGGGQTQAESSGVHTDPLGYLSSARLVRKAAQVLQNSPDGFACVVAFSHTASSEVHCYLHFVRPPAAITGTPSSTGGGKGKKMQKGKPKRSQSRKR
ncbi:hypothetical protein [Fimbriiglobus ruber]|uniref:hypothetical protein n=1 Tax=Fimbriiglobus ruber TaxID=1908690 RepID=UPI00117A7486|nr:hypothetical protein [Fimbriiglobus ruber]